MPYIEVIKEKEAKGRLKEIYDELIRSRGKLAEVHMIQSLNPESIVRHMDLYMHIMFGKSPLRRVSREAIAVVVSQANRCEYCVSHHGAALDHFWKDAEKASAFKKDFRSVELPEMDRRLCEYAWTLTLEPWSNMENRMARMKAAGLSDRMILDATMIISYFNFVNRMVLGLGVELESHKGEGFHYD